ncbi:hypothetical protein [Halobacterium zhouii]|uniref:hypothetical protein n=1 Tax=Halobacterium zhouii TaxID=2902624 RepID=UPI001E2B2BB6|nr:hypothetical protein [Halobacterium zhouii]
MDSRVTLGALLVAGVVLPGVMDFALHQAGYPTLGAAVWATGYAAMVVVVWAGWIRPLDLGNANGGTEP